MHVSGDVLLEASGTANVTPMSRKCRDEQRSRDLGWRERVEKQRRRGRCKAKCNTTIKKKVATAETEREGTKRKKNKRKQVCGGPTSNPASALGFRNRGVISVKTHSQPAYCLNEATFAPPPPPPPKNLFLFSFIISLAITHTKWRKTWKLSIALF